MLTELLKGEQINNIKIGDRLRVLRSNQKRTLQEINLFFLRESLSSFIQDVLRVIETLCALVNADHRGENIEIFIVALFQLLKRLDAFVDFSFFSDHVRAHHLELPARGVLF